MNSKALKKRKKKKIKSRQKQQELRKQNKKTQQPALLGQRNQAELQPVHPQNPPRRKRKLPPQKQLPIPVNTHSNDEKETTTGHKSESEGIVAEKSKGGEEIVNREKRENNEEEDEDEEVEEEDEDLAPPEGFFSPHIADPASLLEDEEEDEEKGKTKKESKKPSDKGIPFSLDNNTLIVGDGNFRFDPVPFKFIYVLSSYDQFFVGAGSTTERREEHGVHLSGFGNGVSGEVSRSADDHREAETGKKNGSGTVSININRVNTTIDGRQSFIRS